MKLPTLARFTDVTLTAMALAWLLFGCYVFGRIHVEMGLVEECNLHQTMTIGADRYDCRTILRGAP